VAPSLRALFPNDEELYGGPLFISDEDAAVELMALPSADEPRTRYRIGAHERDVVLRAEGAHNAQNAAGAAALAATFGLDADRIASGLELVRPAFGRGESFTVDGRRVVLQLVKNPAGFRQSLRTVDRAAPPDAIVIAINDDYADGRDVSWLWDVDFTVLDGLTSRISTAGTRAADMAVRLRYDDIGVEHVEPELEKAVRAAIDAVPPDATVIVFSTYTAMWALHAHFAPRMAVNRPRSRPSQGQSGDRAVR
jgi:UDP-N-acetylmuramyl tripeptide synthase